MGGGGVRSFHARLLFITRTYAELSDSSNMNYVLKPLEFAAAVVFKKNIRADLKVYRLSNVYTHTQVCGTQTLQPHPTVQSLHSGSYLRFVDDEQLTQIISSSYSLNKSVKQNESI